MALTPGPLAPSSSRCFISSTMFWAYHRPPQSGHQAPIRLSISVRCPRSIPASGSPPRSAHGVRAWSEGYVIASATTTSLRSIEQAGPTAPQDADAVGADGRPRLIGSHAYKHWGGSYVFCDTIAPAVPHWRNPLHKYSLPGAMGAGLPPRSASGRRFAHGCGPARRPDSGSDIRKSGPLHVTTGSGWGRPRVAIRADPHTTSHVQRAPEDLPDGGGAHDPVPCRRRRRTPPKYWPVPAPRTGEPLSVLAIAVNPKPSAYIRRSATTCACCVWMRRSTSPDRLPVASVVPTIHAKDSYPWSPARDLPRLPA